MEDFIIWLIVAVFWVIGNITTQKKKQAQRRKAAGQPARPPSQPINRRPAPAATPPAETDWPSGTPEHRRDFDPPPTASPMEEQLRELLEQLGAPVPPRRAPDPNPVGVPAQPVYRAAPPPPAAADLPRRVPSGSSNAAAKAASAMSALEKRIKERQQAAYQKARFRTAKQFQRDTMTASVTESHATVTPRIKLLGMKTIGLLQLQSAFAATHAGHHASVRLDLHNKPQLRRAIAATFILGKPKALEDV